MLTLEAGLKHGYFHCWHNLTESQKALARTCDQPELRALAIYSLVIGNVKAAALVALTAAKDEDVIVRRALTHALSLGRYEEAPGFVGALLLAAADHDDYVATQSLEMLISLLKIRHERSASLSLAVDAVASEIGHIKIDQAIEGRLQKRGSGKDDSREETIVRSLVSRVMKKSLEMESVQHRNLYSFKPGEFIRLGKRGITYREAAWLIAANICAALALTFSYGALILLKQGLHWRINTEMDSIVFFAFGQWSAAGAYLGIFLIGSWMENANYGKLGVILGVILCLLATSDWVYSEDHGAPWWAYVVIPIAIVLFSFLWLYCVFLILGVIKFLVGGILANQELIEKSENIDLETWRALLLRLAGQDIASDNLD